MLCTVWCFVSQGEFYWFELVQMAKKMILTGALVLIKSEEGLSNILVGVLVCLFYVVILTNFKPYAEHDDDSLGKSKNMVMKVLYAAG